MLRETITRIAELILQSKLLNTVTNRYADENGMHAVRDSGVIPLFNGHEIMTYFVCDGVSYEVHLQFGNNPFIITSQVLK